MNDDTSVSLEQMRGFLSLLLNRMPVGQLSSNMIQYWRSSQGMDLMTEILDGFTGYIIDVDYRKITHDIGGSASEIDAARRDMLFTSHPLSIQESQAALPNLSIEEAAKRSGRYQIRFVEYNCFAKLSDMNEVPSGWKLADLYMARCFMQQLYKIWLDQSFRDARIYILGSCLECTGSNDELLGQIGCIQSPRIFSKGTRSIEQAVHETPAIFSAPRDYKPDLDPEEVPFVMIYRQLSGYKGLRAVEDNPMW